MRVTESKNLVNNNRLEFTNLPSVVQRDKMLTAVEEESEGM